MEDRILSETNQLRIVTRQARARQKRIANCPGDRLRPGKLHSPHAKVAAGDHAHRAPVATSRRASNRPTLQRPAIDAKAFEGNLFLPDVHARVQTVQGCMCDSGAIRIADREMGVATFTRSPARRQLHPGVPETAGGTGPILGYTVLSGPHGFRTTQASVGQVAFRSPPVCWGHAIGTADRYLPRCASASHRWSSPTPNWIVGKMAAGGNSNPSPTATPPRAASFVISGSAPGSLNEPVMEIGAGSVPMVKCLASVLIW